MSLMVRTPQVEEPVLLSIIPPLVFIFGVKEGLIPLYLHIPFIADTGHSDISLKEYQIILGFSDDTSSTI
jgi:hypothetical protein